MPNVRVSERLQQTRAAGDARSAARARHAPAAAQTTTKVISATPVFEPSSAPSLPVVAFPAVEVLFPSFADAASSLLALLLVAGAGGEGAGCDGGGGSGD